MEEVKERAHKAFAVECFNGAWELIDKKDRTPEEADRMVHMAHASRFHWGEIGTTLEWERGDWQISRVYRELEQGEPAFTYADRCLKVCQANQIGDFDIAFAFEAMAWAHHLLGNQEMREDFLSRAKEAGEKIEKKEDRGYFTGELQHLLDLV